jgi:multidrug resistance protein, MATE family
VGIFNMVMLSTFRDQIPRIFTDDEEVVSIVSQALLVCAILEFFDATAAISHGLLRGIGRQTIGGIANLFSYYCVALPISLATAFGLGWKIDGLWVGMTIALAT